MLNKPQLPDINIIENLEAFESKLNNDLLFSRQLVNYLLMLKQDTSTKRNSGLTGDDYKKHSAWIEAIEASIKVITNLVISR